MFQINEVGQVLKQEAGSTYELWEPIGMEKEIHILQLGTYQWMVFDLAQGQYVTDTTNTTPMIIDADGILCGTNNPQEYIPTQGKVVIA